MTTQDSLSRRRMLALAGATGLAVAGCVGTENTGTTDGAETAEPGSLGSPAERIEITVTSRPMPSFEPEIVHVEPGATVTWRVADGRHDVTTYHPDTYNSRHHTDEDFRRIPAGAQSWKSDLMTEGNAFEQTIDTVGVYDYVDTQTVCTSHEVVGAIGRIVVGQPVLENEPALADPSDDLPRSAVSKLEAFNERTREAL